MDNVPLEDSESIAGMWNSVLNALAVATVFVRCQSGMPNPISGGVGIGVENILDRVCGATIDLA